jgi:uncharacterized protein YjbJ (UPF0337 family)
LSPPRSGTNGLASLGSVGMGFLDRLSGRLKKATGDLTGDKGLQRQGAREERKADAKEDLQRAHEQVEEQAARVRDADIEAEAERQRRR